LRSKITKDPAPKQAKNLNLENQQEMALKRIQDENEHLKLLNKEKEERIEKLESIVTQLKNDHSKLEEKFKDQNQQCNIDKLIATSISILSSFGTKEDLNSIHLSNAKESGPKMVFF
jgi:predicted nuclease with TOPRIM domain